jgi:hypothetical protein
MMLRRLKQSGLWSVLVALLMAAQLALAFHGVEHKIHPGLLQGDECALCQVASTMAPAPTAEPVAAPSLYASILVDSIVKALPRVSASPAGFRSRAPPSSVSV